MHRTQVASLHKILPIVTLAVLLFCNPLLAGQKKDPRVAGQVSAIEWLASVWSDLSAWLTDGLVPIPEPPSQEDLDNGCIVDPHGGCRG
jgi:hypothetical protein